MKITWQTSTAVKLNKLNEENKLRSPRNLMKGISNGTSFWPFVSFKHKAVQNQMGKNQTFPQYDACILKNK